MSFFNEPISSVVDRVTAGELSCVDLINESASAISNKEHEINAFISLQLEQAQKRALELDSLPLDEKKKKPLLGVPIAIKDNMCIEGVPTTCASKMLDGFKPPYNAAVIESLHNAGAVFVGKTNLDEFAMGSSTETSVFKTTKNPNNIDYIPGGSSGGSAAAVSAGFVPVGMGSDTGGSIRQPCSHCGVAGLKPTYGRVSRYGLVAFASSLDQIGPITRDVRDIGKILSVIAGADERDSTCAGKPFIDDQKMYSGDVKDLTIGIPQEYFGEGLCDSVRGAIDSLVAKLKDAGVKTVDISLPNVQYAIATYYIICTAEASANLARFDGVKYGFRAKNPESLIDMYKKTRQQGFGSEVKRRIMFGTYVLSSGYYDAYYMKAAKVRTLITRDFENAFTKCDALISPVATTPAFKLGEKCDDPLQMYLTDIYTVSANLVGIPGISVPCGKEGDLPIGVQFMAPKWREDTLLRLGYATQMG